MKYVVGFEKAEKFVILYECNNIRIALLMKEKFSKTREETIKIKKRG